MSNNDELKNRAGDPSGSAGDTAGQDLREGRRRLLKAGLVAGPLFVSLYARSTFASPMGSLGMYEYGDDQGEDEEENGGDHHGDHDHDGHDDDDGAWH